MLKNVVLAQMMKILARRIITKHLAFELNNCWYITLNELLLKFVSLLRFLCQLERFLGLFVYGLLLLKNFLLFFVKFSVSVLRVLFWIVEKLVTRLALELGFLVKLLAVFRNGKHF